MNSSAISQTPLFQERVALVKAKELYKRAVSRLPLLASFLIPDVIVCYPLQKIMKIHENSRKDIGKPTWKAENAS